jgi:RNA polymerase sigma-70 factor (subfamily 1)
MFERYYGFVSSLARSRFPAHLRSKLDPEDLVQETFLKARKASEPLANRTDQEIRAFLRKVFKTTLLDQIRIFDRSRRSTAVEQSLEAAPDRSLPPLEAWLAAIQTSPSQGAARNEQLIRLAGALAALPEKQRMALELRYLKGKTLEQTAEAMNTTSGSVVGLVWRGMQKLRDRLEP